jgi:sugar lactone lactonase YvrE
MKLLRRAAVALVVLAALVATALLGILLAMGGGERLEDRTTEAALPGSALEVVVDLDYPPGNVAVSKEGRVFFTLHPDGNPPDKVLELVDGTPVPYPSADFQRPSPDGGPHFESILSLRIDAQNRLWTLDFANFGRGQPRLLAFDLATDALVHQYDFPSDVAGLFSMLNDLQIAPDGRMIFIAETSPIIQRPALVVYDTENRLSRRVLDGHPSVASEDYIIQAPGRDMILFGIATLRIPVDSIALDRQGKYLYYGPVTGSRMYRIATQYLTDAAVSAEELASRVEDFGPKTLSDGLTMDLEDNIFISDMEHSAVLTLGPDRTLRTLIKDPRLRWPDGFSFGPDGWLYVTCSALQHVLFVSAERMRANAPYQIFRFKPGTLGVPGH